MPALADVDVPAGHRPVVEPGEARAMWEQVPAVSGVLREDSRLTRRAVWWALCEHMHTTGVIVATQARIAERASVHRGSRVARQTAGNHMRALVEAGVLVVAMPGASAEALGSEVGRAGAYVIVTACPDPSAGPVDELGHLPEGSTDSSDLDGGYPRMCGDFSSSTPHNSHRDVGADTVAQSVLGHSGDGSWLTERAQHPEHFAPRTAAERGPAVWWLAGVMGWTAQPRIEEELGKITGPFFRSGWSPRAVLHAWQHRPDGSGWPCSLPAPHQRDSANAPRPRSLWAVLTWRMQAWRGPDGSPLASPVEVRQPRRGRPPGEAARRRQRAELEAPGGTQVAGRQSPRTEAAAAVAAARASLAAVCARNAAERADRAARAARLCAELAPVPAAVVDVDQEVMAAPDPAAVRRARAILRARAERAGRVVARIGSTSTRG